MTGGGGIKNTNYFFKCLVANEEMQALSPNAHENNEAAKECARDAAWDRVQYGE